MSDYRKDFREFQGDYFWTLPRALFMGVFGIVCLCVIGFALNFFGYANFGFFAPHYEAVRRDTVINSRQYQEGIYRELSRLKLQYVQAKTPEEKDTIRAMVLHESQAFDKSRLPADMAAFVTSLGG